MVSAICTQYWFTEIEPKHITMVCISVALHDAAKTKSQTQKYMCDAYMPILMTRSSQLN